MITSLKYKRFIVIDLYSGRYMSNNVGHEVYNIKANNVDGRYYGYCPPHDNPNIDKLGACKDEQFVDGVMVIYVKKHRGTSNREIIAFCDNTTVYRDEQYNDNLERIVVNNGIKEKCSYTIESDYMHDLRSYPNKFIIDLSRYSKSMFHSQRFYKGTYKSLDMKIISYLENYLNEIDNADDAIFQQKIQNEMVLPDGSFYGSSERQPQCSNGSVGMKINKSSKVSKYALSLADYKCEYDASHVTFKTSKGCNYMEGHHLIPCTYSNAMDFWYKYHRNIDSEANIVSLCPICHRRIHFGSADEKKKIISRLYNQRVNRLKSIGVNISLDELLELYGL